MYHECYVPEGEFPARGIRRSPVNNFNHKNINVKGKSQLPRNSETLEESAS